MPTRWRLLIAGLLLVAAATGALSATTTPAEVQSSPGTAGPDSVPAGESTAAPDPPLVGDSPYQDAEVDRTVMEISLQADGSARWTVEHRVRLEDTNDTRGFERTRTRIAKNRSAFRDPFAQRVRAMATSAETDTDRTMVVENVTVETYREQLPREYGVVAYEFRWYGFAETDDRLRAGDALAGLFLDEETTLLISWPADAELAAVTPEPDERRDRAVVWNGPIEFATGEPRVVLDSDALSFGPDLGFDAGSNDVPIALGAVLLVFGTSGTGVIVWRRRRGSDGVPEREQDGQTAADERETATDAGTESDAAGPSPDGSDSTTPDSGEAPGAPDEQAPPSELLSNEERVLQLLDDNGGRMKQQAIVETLDWSETKTSEVVSELREDDTVEVYRLGRENVLALPDVGLGIDDDSAGENE